MAIRFDPLAYSSELEAAGVPQGQAKVHARALANVLSDAVCVRDLSRVENNLRDEMRAMESRLIARIDQVRADLGNRIEALHTEFSARIDLLKVELNVRIDLLGARIESVRVELMSAIAEIKADNASIHRELVIHRWLFGVIIAMNGATLAIAMRGGL